MLDTGVPAGGGPTAGRFGGRAARLLRSSRLALALLLGIAVLSVPGTLYTPARAAEAVRALAGAGFLPAARALGLVDPYRSPLFVSLLALLCANIAACTVHRLRSLAARHRQGAALPGARLGLWSDALMHLSLIVVLAGGAAKAVWGFTATQPVLPGRPQTTAFDTRTETDVPLGFTLLLEGIEETHYPTRAAIGVKDAPTGRKIALVEVVEGRAAPVPGTGVTLALEGFDPGSGTVSLAVTGGPRPATLRLEAAQGGKSSAEDAGLGFTLVAYHRELLTIRGRMTISEPGAPARPFRISPTDPVVHRGTMISLTAWGVHPEEGRYLGLQFSRDPFAPLFWGGCALLCLSLPLFVLARLRRPPPRRGEAPAPVP